MGAHTFFPEPRVKVYEPAAALPVSSDRSGQALGERAAELGCSALKSGCLGGGAGHGKGVGLAYWLTRRPLLHECLRVLVRP